MLTIPPATLFPDVQEVPAAFLPPQPRHVASYVPEQMPESSPQMPEYMPPQVSQNMSQEIPDHKQPEQQPEPTVGYSESVARPWLEIPAAAAQIRRPSTVPAPDHLRMLRRTSSLSPRINRSPRQRLRKSRPKSSHPSRSMSPFSRPAQNLCEMNSCQQGESSQRDRPPQRFDRRGKPLFSDVEWVEPG